MKINPNTNTDPNSSLANETEELNDQDLIMIVGGDGEAGDPEAEEEKRLIP